MRPLFSTSFLIDDFLADNEFFGARAVILSSASSKTAYGTAFRLAQRRGTENAVRVVGLTSPANLAFTRELGCYDAVLSYDDIPAALADERSVYVDFSGSLPLRAAVHESLADNLAYSCLVGATHWDKLGGGALPGQATRERLGGQNGLWNLIEGHGPREQEPLHRSIRLVSTQP